MNRPVEEGLRMGTVNYEYEKTFSDNTVFAGRCAVMITKVGHLCARLACL